jgi:cholesterol transport system auxiliary component
MIAVESNSIKRLSGASICLATVFSLAALTGCNSPASEKQFFILDVTRPVKPAPASKPVGTVLEVRRFRIDSAFDSKSLVYRVDEYRYESDFYNEFLLSPEEMITEKTREWLSSSGLFEMVSGLGVSVRPPLTLKGDITALYGDYRVPSASKAVMEIQLLLVENGDLESKIVFGKDYKAIVDVKSQGVEGLIAAYSEGLDKILTELESDIAEKIGKPG